MINITNEEVSARRSRRGIRDSRRRVWPAVLWKALSVLLVLLIHGVSCELHSQTVSHPASAITATASHHIYEHLLSASEKKNISYILVRASNGDIKTVFNACDVCYLAYKGYSQSATDLRCNNCGNRFAIDTLGGSNTAGTCSPGYLPHRLEAEQVVIDVADLVAGAYYFRSETVTAIVAASVVADEIAIEHRGNAVFVTAPREGNRMFRVFTLGGKQLSSFRNDSRIVRIPTGELVPGAYLIAVNDGRLQSSKVFLVP